MPLLTLLGRIIDPGYSHLNRVTDPVELIDIILGRVTGIAANGTQTGATPPL